MKYNKNSLLVKSIFYNDIAIILSSFVVFLTVSFILFVGQNDKLPSILEDSNKKIAISYKNLVENIIKNNFVPSWDYDSIPLETLMNLKNLYTKEI